VINGEALKNKLKKIIEEVGHMQGIKDDIGKEFKSRNLNGIRAARIFMGNEDLNTLDDNENDNMFLFLFCFALNKALDSQGLNEYVIEMKEYFTEVEFQKWVSYSAEKTEQDVYPLTLYYMVEIIPNKIWQGYLSAQEINRWNMANLITYNFRTQRNPKITVSGEKINIDTAKIEEIKERLLSGIQFPDQLKFNLLRNGEDKFNYNSKSKTLVILSGIINIFDGYHRKTANSLAIEENPDLVFNWPVIITNMSEKEAHDYMVQIDKQKPIKKEYIESMDYNKTENLAVDAIIDNKFSDFAKTIKEDDNYIRLNRALTKKSIIATAIKENYSNQIKNTMDMRNISGWVVEFMDYLMGSYSEEFITNPYKIKKTSFINHKNMFFGYIALSKVLYGKDDWRDSLKKVVDSIDFNLGNSLWKDIGLIGNNDANKTLRYKLYNLFEEAL
jgi:hypothetical protein